jgi:predicted GNAT family acetyltransferase
MALKELDLGEVVHKHTTPDGENVNIVYSGGILPHKTSNGKGRMVITHAGGFTLTARANDGDYMGHIHVVADAKMNGDHFVDMVKVDDEHQRKGIASAMYHAAEKHIGKFLKPSQMQLPDGRAFWENRRKKFGAIRQSGLQNESVSKPLLEEILSDFGKKITGRYNAVHVKHGKINIHVRDNTYTAMKEGVEIGILKIIRTKNGNIFPAHTIVEAAHRRMGVNTALYKVAEQHTGRTMIRKSFLVQASRKHRHLRPSQLQHPSCA